VGNLVGCRVDVTVGDLVGAISGTLVGGRVNITMGVAMGALVGDFETILAGVLVGDLEGTGLGATVKGAAIGVRTAGATDLGAAVAILVCWMVNDTDNGGPLRHLALSHEYAVTLTV
jgi:hypothetical protein